MWVYGFYDYFKFYKMDVEKMRIFNRCIDCNKIICKISIRCKSCSNKFRKGKYNCKPISESHKKRLSEANKGKKLSKKHIEIIRKNMLENNPSKRDDVKKKLSKYRIQWFKDNPEKNKLRIKKLSKIFSQEGNPNWRGGISYDPYSSEFNKKLKKKILIRDNYKCKICNKKAQCIHHIDYNKKNNKEYNLLAACFSCNAKMNFKREDWIDVCKSIMVK